MWSGHDLRPKTLILTEDPYFDWRPLFWAKTLLFWVKTLLIWVKTLLHLFLSRLTFCMVNSDSSFCWVCLFFWTMEFFFLTMEIMQTGIGSILAQMSKCVNLGCLSFLLWFRKHNLITTPKNASITLFSAEVRPTCSKTLKLPGQFKKLRTTSTLHPKSRFSQNTFWRPFNGPSWYGVATTSRLFKIVVSFAKEPYKRNCILQKRPRIWRSLLIVATTYHPGRLTCLSW